MCTTDPVLINSLYLLFLPPLYPTFFSSVCVIRTQNKQDEIDINNNANTVIKVLSTKQKIIFAEGG